MGIIDSNTEFGRKALKFLEEQGVVWLTTIAPDGTPQPNPVWFYWDRESILIYSQPEAYKVRNILNHPRVSLHFEGATLLGGDVVVLLGDALIGEEAPRPDPNYIEKYRQAIEEWGTTAEEYTEEYSVAIRVTPTRVRGF